MAIVILGGLATSTLLSLLVLPTLALRFGRFGNHDGDPSDGGPAMMPTGGSPQSGDATPGGAPSPP